MRSNEQEVRWRNTLMSTPRQHSSTSPGLAKRNSKAVVSPAVSPQTPAPLPATDNREGWHAHWQVQGQPWRTEPEIDQKRQEELATRRAIVPDLEKGIYPFGGTKLTWCGRITPRLV